ncbi:hypothetical protein QBC47DRAFT_394507 [Echria macrotheca]|uniref:Uncharacterized protein n=1 Tax=Echria macrotheca TaxID=438768 RepID=A0AAJ0B536_9PEZI|nr:hypothetical protein QBC47DRAFT_394507 [Echria macrotheca]
MIRPMTLQEPLDLVPKEIASIKVVKRDEMTTVAIVGTCDTKLQELVFLRDRILSHSPPVQVILIDVGRHPVSHEAIAVPQTRLLTKDDPSVTSLPRGELIKLMSDSAASTLSEYFNQGRIHGVIAAGGSGNTSLVTAAMRSALPIGFPKLVVSTVASGDTAPYVGDSDIAMLYSVVDVAGLNSVLRSILINAAAMICGAAIAYHDQTGPHSARVSSDNTENTKTIAITMFGVTTPCVDAIRAHLDTKYPGRLETLVFHATGTGGRAMERLIGDGRIDGVLDLTTTEICDLVAGGNMSAGPDRLSAAVFKEIPCVVSLGALDMVNFGPRATVPERYAGRKLYEHNPAVTLMRVDADEARQVGEFIVEKLKTAEAGKVEVWIPKGGLSLLSKSGAAFEDSEVDEVLFRTLRNGFEGTAVRVVEDQRDINDEEFARDIADALVSMMG